MAGYTWQVAALSPAAVAVHNDGDVLRETLQIYFVEGCRFLGIGRLQEFACFHYDWLEG